MSDPVLPQDLERRIFQLAAHNRIAHVNLMLLAKRVYNWTAPILYQSVKFDSFKTLDNLVATITSNRKVFALAVHKITIGVPSHLLREDSLDLNLLMLRLIESCTNMTEMKVGDITLNNVIYSRVAGFPLTRLSVGQGAIHLLKYFYLGITMMSWPQPPVTLSLTHLRITVPPFPPSYLDCFKALTHFAIAGCKDNRANQVLPTGFSPVISGLLDRSGPEYAVMKAVVLFQTEQCHLRSQDFLDIRVVDGLDDLTLNEDDLRDFWETADNIVVQRRISSAT